MAAFAAGTSGAIGQPLTAELVRKRHAVRAMMHSQAGTKRLREYGAEMAVHPRAQDRAHQGERIEPGIDENARPARAGCAGAW
jgi:hypothetical protein